MRAALFFIGLLIHPLSIFCQTSFDDYFAIAKQGISSSREAEFTASCGLQRSDATIVYGVSTADEGWKWQRRKSLGHGRDDAQTDFYGAAVVWKVAGRPRFVNAWMLIMDTGNTNNEMFCLDEFGHVTAQESLNAYQPVDGQGTGWRYIQQIKFLPPCKKIVLHGQFVNEAGAPIPAPKLDKEDMQVARVSLSSSLAHDLIAQLSR